MIHDKGRNTVLNDFGFTNPIIKKENPIFIGECNKMKFEVEQSVKLEDGKHDGVIVELEHREKPFNYVDVVIEETKTKGKIRCGYPYKVLDDSALGRLLVRFGAILEVGKGAELEDFLKKGIKVEFMTLKKTTDTGTYSNIIRESLKPLK